MPATGNMADVLVFLILISILCSNVCGKELCPFGWTYDETRDRCIKAMDQVMEYENAAISCRSCGGGLIRLENSQDQNTADNLIKAHNTAGKKTEWGYFIDMNDKETTTEWKFDNGDVVSWINWASGQPNGQDAKYLPDGQHCMALEYSSFKWHDTACRGTNLHYICMRKSGSEAVTENRYRKVQSGCLRKHYELRGYTSTRPSHLQKFTCLAECDVEPCCTAVAVSDNECTLYAFDPSVTYAHCGGSSYKVFVNKNV